MLIDTLILGLMYGVVFNIIGLFIIKLRVFFFIKYILNSKIILLNNKMIKFYKISLTVLKFECNQTAEIIYNITNIFIEK